MLNFLKDNLAIVTLIALSVVFLLLLGVVFWAAMRGDESSKEKSGTSKPQRINIDSLKQSFKFAVELIEANIVARSERYNIPWVLVINESDGNKALPLVQSGLQSALSADSTLSAAAQGIQWNFFDKGIAVQLQSAYLGSAEGDDPDNKTWDEFLGLCRDYRSDRPFDSIVLSVPANLLLSEDPQAFLELTTRAKSLHRRLWLAQNRLALRFPIYLLISGCESIPGFARFAGALPETMRSSMLGWSSPYEIGAPFQPEWIDAAMNTMVSSLSDACAELSALELSSNDSSEYFLLPTQVERLRAGLRLFADELMRPSAYHEPFLLRGLYLTGDCSEAAEIKSQEPEADSVDSCTADGDVATTYSTQDFGLEPAFLRDVFENKIFGESGLVRPSTARHLRRPALGNFARWSAVGFIGVWTVGLVYSSVLLNRSFTEVAAAIQRLDKDSQATLDAQRYGSDANVAISNARAVDALATLTQVDAGALWSVFMPGSWPYVDRLQDRVQSRLEQQFLENSQTPLRRGIYARVSGLTGVTSDPSTGALIQDAPCTLPMGWSALVEGKPGGGISVEELPEFSATLQYLANIEQVDKVLNARRRLTSGPGAPDGADLQLVVSAVLGKELPVHPERAAWFFRKYSNSVPEIDIGAMRAAAACSFDLAMKAVHKRLFKGNELLQVEQDLAAQSSHMTASRGAGMEASQAIEAWKDMYYALRREKDLFGPGKGAWIQRSSLQLGQAYDAMMRRVSLSPLLGAVPAERTHKQAEEAFSKFLNEWDAAVNVDEQSLVGGLVWSETENRWAFSDSRQALYDALGVLLEQPFMSSVSNRALPNTSAQATVNWDKAKLDQAIAIADVRKRFQTDILPKFPVNVRPDVEHLVNTVLAQSLIDVTAQSIAVASGAAYSAPLGDAERTRIARVQALMTEFGAKAAADQLTDIVAKDALARLKQLDDVLVRADIYVPPERDFKSWNGDKSPLLQAFGAGDAASLTAYVGQQQSKMDQLGREANVLLLAIEGGVVGNPLVQKWQAIANDLERYRLKSPTSSLLALEQFVLTGAADIDQNNCTEKLPMKPAGRRANDLFTERLQQIQSGLAGRCRELKAVEQRQSWSAFADTFNKEVSARAPFSAPVVTNAGVRIERPPADPDEIAVVLKQFERAHKALLQRFGEQNGSKSAPNLAVRRFDEQMERVRAFMAPLYPADESTAVGYDVAVEFRANTAAEIDGNKIIDWALTMGNQTLRQREPLKMLRWEPGMPVTLSLRVARDAPAVPVNAGVAGVSVDDKTVSYKFSDPWALYTFVSQHREPEGGARSDNRSQLLKFDFPIKTVSDNPKLPSTESLARVFLRLTISPAGKRTPLAWPGVFPVRAPEWTTP